MITLDDENTIGTCLLIEGGEILGVYGSPDECGRGDRVRMVETRPLSKDKRWRVVEILEKAK